MNGLDERQEMKFLEEMMSRKMALVINENTAFDLMFGTTSVATKELKACTLELLEEMARVLAVPPSVLRETPAKPDYSWTAESLKLQHARQNLFPSGFFDSVITFTPHALKNSEIRLFPKSRHRSARIHKKLIKRHGGEFLKIPAIFEIDGKIVAHPDHKQEFDRLQNQPYVDHVMQIGIST